MEEDFQIDEQGGFQSGTLAQKQRQRAFETFLLERGLYLSLTQRLKVVVEAAFLSLVIFRLLTLFFNYIFPSHHLVFYLSILFTHYLTVLLCGFWCGWRIRVDGWLYGILAFGAYYILRQIFGVFYPLPLDVTYKLLLLIPLLALLLIGAVYGEIAAERREESRFKSEELL